MNKLVGRKIISYNIITGDVVVGIYEGNTQPRKHQEYFVIVKPTFFVLNKSKTKHMRIQLDTNTWRLLRFTPNHTKLVSKMRKLKRMNSHIMDQMKQVSANIQILKRKMR